MNFWRTDYTHTTCDCDSESRSSSSVDDNDDESWSSLNSSCQPSCDEQTDVLNAMKLLETSVYQRPRAQDMPEIFRGLWRRQIVEWMYVLIKYCKLKHEATAAAVYYLDAAVLCTSAPLVLSPRDYQLCAMTALHLALKVYDSPSVRVVKLGCLVKLGNGEFIEDDIIQKEQDLLRALNWRINPPTADCFLQRYLGLLPFLDDEDAGEHDEDADDDSTRDGDNSTNYDDQLGPIERRRRERLLKLEEVASEYIEVAMARDRFLAVPPSVIAYASLLSAMEVTTDPNQRISRDYDRRQREHCCYYDWSTFLRNMTSIAGMGDILSDDNAYGIGSNKNGNRENNGVRVSRSVHRTKMLLDRIVKGLALPPEEEDDVYFKAAPTRNKGYSNENSNSENDIHHNNEDNEPESAKLTSTVTTSSPPSPTSTMSSNTASQP
mmetsp:Transcript_17842/g.36668  ORF Transcript_17842/g.36668 Transcript_17842/m.36668 type:complete len:435 (+) Transcript_17842:140-1444(+)|eukprot:CAMPEP_0201124492 /NCGR_PEP_ID=MMETSP0850-20130426/14123_1 /ASSEMBLY_ACC=CAM_ASM_000622 /TAXON_ID=183588 /ORGANISM="Pseudo-nitzschia fraudulenta, Strain WWA7" /LENGTH=434 /DNA_ID=CAMNT_0047391911 /DNA_START=115 /DNA_END=1419 /DNA_ORIENTATION=-